MSGGARSGGAMRGVLAGGIGGTILPDDAATPVLLWTVSGTTEIDEGETGTYTVSYTGVTLAPAQTATIAVASAAGGDATLTDATAGSDYTALSTVLTFTGGGATQKTVALSTIEDIDIEGDEDFTVSLGSPSRGSIASGSVVTGITDDDAAAYVADAVTFDGTNDYLTRGEDFDANSDGKEGTVVFAVKFNGGDGALQRIFESTSTRGLSINRTDTNIFHFEGRDSGGVTRLTIESDSAYVAASGWLVVMASWNLATGAGHFYVGHTEDMAASPTLVDADIDYTRANHSVGANPIGSSKLNADLGDFWFGLGYIDLSVEANRLKFIDAMGKPIDLGSDGSKPGVSPILFLHLGDGETPADNYAINAGAGGGMTVNGALAVAVSSPTD